MPRRDVRRDGAVRGRVEGGRRRPRRVVALEALEPRIALAGNYNLGFAFDFGNTGQDIALGVAVDASGNSYVTGNYVGTVDFDPGPGTANLTSTPGAFSDGFLARYDPTGALAWVKDMGPGDYNGYAGVAVDGSGNVLATGFFSGTVNFDQKSGSAAGSLTALGNSAAYVTKYDPTGALIWAEKFDSTSTSSLNGASGQSLTTDGSGNVYVTGNYGGTVDFDPGPGTALHTNPGGNANAFIVKLSSSGALAWADTFDGKSGDWITGIGVDGPGNVYATGLFYDADFDPGPGGVDTLSNGSTDVFDLKLNPSGSLVWVDKFGSSATEYSENGLGVDAAGNTYTAQLSVGSNGATQGAMTKLDPSGNVTWTVRYVSNTSTAPEAIAFDGSGVDVAIFFTSTLQVGNGDDASTYTSQSYSNLIVARYDTSGNLLTSGALTGTGGITGHGIAAQSDGKVWLAGSLNGSIDADPGPGTDTLTSDGTNASDGVVVQLAPASQAAPSITAVSATTDFTTDLNLSYQIDGDVTGPVDIGLYRSDDANFDGGDVLLGTLTLSDPADLSPGQHLKTVPIGNGAGQVPMPGVGAAEINSDYSILMVVDPTNAVMPGAAAKATPLVGAYFDFGTGNLYVLGSPGDDTITLAPSGSYVELTGLLRTRADYGGVTAVHVRAGFGFDTITGAGLAVPLWFFGGEGNDTLQGGTVSDHLDGGGGSDTSDGGGGSDTFNVAGAPGAVDDTITIKLSGSTIQATRGADVDQITFDPSDTLHVQGGDGNDRITIATAIKIPATLDGGPGNDTLTGGGGPDTLLGGDGNDVLDGGPGDDSIDGGAGTDTWTVNGTSAADQIDAVLGSGTLTIRRGPGLESDTGLGFERLKINGNGGDDRIDLTGLPANPLGAPSPLIVTLNGGAGNDTLLGGGGNDVLLGGAGDDAIDGGAGNDRLDGGAGNDAMTGGPGHDTFVFRGSSGDDLLTVVPLSGTQLQAQRSDRAAPGTVLETDLFTIDASDKVSVLAGNGNDLIQADPSITIAGVVDGGAGTDTCTAPANWSKKNCEA